MWNNEQLLMLLWGFKMKIILGYLLAAYYDVIMRHPNTVGIYGNCTQINLRQRYFSQWVVT